MASHRDFLELAHTRYQAVSLQTVVLRKRELKSCPRTLVRGCPQPPAVILHNGPADREPHAHTLTLGGVKGVKNLLP